MAEHSETPGASAESGPGEAVALSRLSGEVPFLRWPSSLVNISTLFKEIPLREPPSFPEWIGAWLANRVLWFICIMAAAFALAWWWKQPSLREVQAILGSAPDPKTVLETWRELQRDHFDHFQSLFQTVVLSGLVPLFTLLAGYAFGSREKAQKQGESQKAEDEP